MSHQVEVEVAPIKLEVAPIKLEEIALNIALNGVAEPVHETVETINAPIILEAEAEATKVESQP